MRKFDYSFLNNGLLPANLVNLTSNITALKTMAGMRREEYTKIFTELEAVAKIQSIKSSNAIEGIVTSDERIAAIVNQNSAPLNHNEAEIAGYRDALNEIHSGYEHIDFRQRDILRLHEVMMGFTGYEYGGKYKTDDNVILEIDADGNRRVRFRPTPASETPEAMEQLEFAYFDARCDANINQLLLIPCVILDFLCIHPFRDGNGRMSRLLSLLLLYKNGEPYEPLTDVYVEVDIDNQKLTVYKEGEVVISTDVVTGNLNGFQTITGLYYAYNKETDQWMSGEDYLVFSKYWIGIDGAYGLHDASWRTHFGKDFYVNGGSHGCVNIPVDAMPTIFETVEVGDAIILFGKNKWFEPDPETTRILQS